MYTITYTTIFFYPIYSANVGLHVVYFIKCSIKAKSLTYEKNKYLLLPYKFITMSYYSCTHIQHFTVQDEALQTRRLASQLGGNSS